MGSVAIAASLVMAAGVGYFAASNKQVTREPTVTVVGPGSVDSLRVAVVPDSGSAAPDASVPVQPGTPNAPVAAAPAQPESQTSAQLAVATLTADYGREMVRLRRLIEERRNQLDPATVAIIEKNLVVIDAAIAECQRAIGRDPSSRFLIESLNQSLQNKVELMRTAALLPPRT